MRKLETKCKPIFSYTATINPRLPVSFNQTWKNITQLSRQCRVQILADSQKEIKAKNMFSIMFKHQNQSKLNFCICRKKKKQKNMACVVET